VVEVVEVVVAAAAALGYMAAAAALDTGFEWKDMENSEEK
jgi:hypothetical protein